MLPQSMARIQIKLDELFLPKIRMRATHMVPPDWERCSAEFHFDKNIEMPLITDTRLQGRQMLALATAY